MTDEEDRAVADAIIARVCATTGSRLRSRQRERPRSIPTV